MDHDIGPRCMLSAIKPSEPSAGRTRRLVAPWITGGNEYRLISEMNFTRKVLFIGGIMTHKEYEKGGWKS